VFVARLPPLGYSTFVVQPAPDCSQPLPTAARGGSTVTGGKDRYASLDNGIVSLEFDTHTGAAFLPGARCHRVLPALLKLRSRRLPPQACCTA
jgi:hypothetical protein